MRRSGQPIRASLLAAAALLTCFGSGFGASPVFAAGAYAPKKHDAKRQVEALEEQWRLAQLTGDAATMDKMLSDDYIGISMSGQVSTKAQQLDRVRARKVTISKVELSDMKVKMVGAIAIVTSRAEVEGTNETGPVSGTYRYTRVYQRVPTGWKITSFEATKIPAPKPPRDQPAAEATPPNSPPVSEPHFN